MGTGSATWSSGPSRRKLGTSGRASVPDGTAGLLGIGAGQGKVQLDDEMAGWWLLRRIL